jgi:hypothetical protein
VTSCSARFISGQGVDVMHQFIGCFVEEVREKLAEQYVEVQDDRALFVHTIDEVVKFEKVRGSSGAVVCWRVVTRCVASRGRPCWSATRTRTPTRCPEWRASRGPQLLAASQCSRAVQRRWTRGSRWALRCRRHRRSVHVRVCTLTD